jgi:hypothetical protein
LISNAPAPANDPLENPSNWPPPRAPVQKSKIRDCGWNNLFQPVMGDNLSPIFPPQPRKKPRAKPHFNPKTEIPTTKNTKFHEKERVCGISQPTPFLGMPAIR